MPDSHPIVTRLDSPEGSRFVVHFHLIGKEAESPLMSSGEADELEQRVHVAVMVALLGEKGTDAFARKVFHG